MRETQLCVKITPLEKGETRRGGEQMRDYRQNPSFWPFTGTDFGEWISYRLSIQLSASNGIPSLIELSLLWSSVNCGIFIANNFLRGCFARRTWKRIKSGSVGNTRLLPHGRMLLVPMVFSSPTSRLCSGGKLFDWANVIFAAYFILRGRDTHIDFLRLLFMVGMICLSMQEHFLWPLFKCKAL